MLHFFLNYQYDPSQLKIPETKGLLDQKFHGLSCELKWWHNCLCDEKIGDHQWGDLYRDLFYSAYISFCKQTNVKRPVDKKWLARELQKNCTFKLDRDKQVFGNGWQYTLLPIEQCRENFEKMMGHKLNWEGD